MTGKLRLTVLLSGQGTNLQAILNIMQHNILPIEVVQIISNNGAAFANVLKMLGDTNIRNEGVHWDRSKQSREEYDREVIQVIKQQPTDLIVLAGWMHIFTEIFTSEFPNTINLHPALPNGFVGRDCPEQAFQAFQRGEIKYTGIMCHYVTEKLDRGRVLSSMKIPIYGSDSLDDLIGRIKQNEKGVLISGIQHVISNRFEESIKEAETEVYIGKVRNVYDIGYGLLLMEATDRTSGFDRYLCDVPDKGILLNLMSRYWFNQTKHICPNHLVWSTDRYSIVKKCVPFKIEVVVRGFITGSTNTSLWTHYRRGVRNFCGVSFPDGLVKNQQLEKAVITPTTKGIVDKPITPEEIVAEKYMAIKELNYVFQKAFELFEYGQNLAEQHNLLLVDTKYEFGRTNSGEIVLIDELHTCDSSRYWIKDTYKARFEAGEEPEKLDKDQIRDWVKSQCDPYKDELPKIPAEIVDLVFKSYSRFYKILCNKPIMKVYNKTLQEVVDLYLNRFHDKICIILAGSEKDAAHVDKIKAALKNKEIYGVSIVASAHKQTVKVMEILREYNSGNQRIIWITVAGRSNALSGVIAANTQFPVIACPPFADKMDMMVNINSTLQCPSNVPVMTILEPTNVALAVGKMFDL